MDGWVNGQVGGWMDEWVDGWMDGWMDGWVNGWVGGWMDEWMDEWMDGWTSEWMDGWMDEWMDGWVDGWMDGWVDGWTLSNERNKVVTTCWLNKLFFLSKSDFNCCIAPSKLFFLNNTSAIIKGASSSFWLALSMATHSCSHWSKWSWSKQRLAKWRRAYNHWYLSEDNPFQSTCTVELC